MSPRMIPRKSPGDNYRVHTSERSVMGVVVWKSQFCSTVVSSIH